jgi:hypothetical protein
LVNLIPNDGARSEDFAVFQSSLMNMLELTGVLLILIFYLNVAAGFAWPALTYSRSS